MVQRIVYFEDPVFRAIFDAQRGPLPYPVKQDPEVAVLRRELAELKVEVKAQLGKGNFGYRAADAESAVTVPAAGDVADEMVATAELPQAQQKNDVALTEVVLAAGKMRMLDEKIDLELV
jgi:type IV secretion system protein VirD4